MNSETPFVLIFDIWLFPLFFFVRLNKLDDGRSESDETTNARHQTHRDPSRRSIVHESFTDSYTTSWAGRADYNAKRLLLLPYTRRRHLVRKRRLLASDHRSLAIHGLSWPAPCFPLLPSYAIAIPFYILDYLPAQFFLSQSEREIQRVEEDIRLEKNISKER